MTTLRASNNTHNCRGELCLNTGTRWGRKDILFKQWLTVKTVGMNQKFFVSDITLVISVTSETFFFLPQCHKKYLIICSLSLSDAKDWHDPMFNESKLLWKWIKMAQSVSCLILWTLSHRVTYIYYFNWMLIILITTCHKTVGQAKHILIWVNVFPSPSRPRCPDIYIPWNLTLY